MKLRVPRISLAAKYRLLFGCAVLLIIGAALSMPWYYMEYLIMEAPFREAERGAEDYLRLVLGRPEDAPPALHAAEMLNDDDRPAALPQFIRFPPDLSNPEAITGLGETAPFIGEAFRAFVRDRNRDNAFRLEDTEDGRQFHYAMAVRASRNCLSCHAEGQSARAFRENELAGMIAVRLPADKTMRGLTRNRLVLIVAGALAGVLAILVFYLIVQRFILAPIDELRSVALRVADGDLAVRSNVRTGDEFEQLPENLNTMLERLRASQEELRAANVLLDEKLGQMAESNVALYEANRVKSEFLANVSHELRTPLTSIIGFAELLREGKAGDESEKVRRYSENILISGRILLEIINDLLDLAKIEAGKVDLNVAPVDLPDLCNAMVNFMRPQADAKGLRLTVWSAEDLAPRQTDAGKLRQILFNLLSNAIKFTQEGGHVELIAQPEQDGRVYIAVRDNGPGIAPENHAKVFEKFRQVERSETRTVGGTGLGLAIAKELVELLGGELGLISELGKGATFWVRLPNIVTETVTRPSVSLT